MTKNQLESEWSPKNKFPFSNYKPHSFFKAIWLCNKSTCKHPHEWRAIISNRTKGSGCPFCSGRSACPCNSLAVLRPDLLAEWHPKNKVSAKEVSLYSNKKAWWQCKKSTCNHSHEWLSTIDSRTARGSGCPFCRGNNFCPCNSLAELRPDLLAEWHPKNKISPDEVSLYSGKKVWWLCKKSTCEHPHEWEATISNRANGMGCPFFSGRVICPCNSLAVLRPDLLTEWHPKNKISPDEVSLHSNKKVWWLCDKSTCEHPHEWKATINSRTKGSNCPFCSSPSKSTCPCNSLAELRPDLLAEWHPKNKVSPYEVSLGSSIKVRWLCKKSSCEHPHEWEATINSRTSSGRGCPFCCSSKGEKAVRKILNSKKICYEEQKKIYTTHGRLRLDFYLPGHKAAIEFDGIQHFEPIEFFGGELAFLKQQIKDLAKDYYCMENNIKILRIHYSDVEKIEFLINFLIGRSGCDPGSGCLEDSGGLTVDHCQSTCRSCAGDGCPHLLFYL